LNPDISVDISSEIELTLCSLVWNEKYCTSTEVPTYGRPLVEVWEFLG